MLRASILLFFFGLFSMFLGLYRLAGVSFELGRLLLFAFLALAILSFIGALISRRRIGPPL
jgi:hypothetical protein